MWHKRPKYYWYRLTDDLLTTFTYKFLVDKRSLVLRGSDFFHRYGRRVYNLDMERICDYMDSHPSIYYLDLAYNLIEDKGLESLINFIQTHPEQLIGLNLMCNSLTDLGMKMLAKCGNELTLQSLRINGNKITSRGQKWIAKLLMTNSYLRHLDIAEMDMHMNSLVHILGALRHLDRGSNDTLTILDLSRPLGPLYHQFQADQWAERIGQMLQYNNNLRELHLEKSHMRGSSIEHLARGLRGNKTLRVLDIACNAFGPDGALHLANLLKDANHCPPLQALIMNRCEIGDHGAGYLSYALPCSKIRMLDIAYNNLTDEGVLNILYTIRKPIVLNILYIWGNKMTDETCQIIERMLLSKVLSQDRLDVTIYRVDGQMHLAQSQVDRYKHLYYVVDDYGWPQPKCLRTATRYYNNPLQIEQTRDNKLDKLRKPEYPNKLLDPFGIAVLEFLKKQLELQPEIYDELEEKYEEEEEYEYEGIIIEELEKLVDEEEKKKVEIIREIVEKGESEIGDLQFSSEATIKGEFAMNQYNEE